MRVDSGRADTVACVCVTCGYVGMQSADADERWARLRADALRVVWCGRRWWWSEGNEIRRKKERNLQSVDGRRDCVQIHAWAVVADEGKKKKKTHQVQMVDANACGRVADSEGDETRKKETEAYWVWMADAIVCGHVPCAWAMDTDEGDEKSKSKNLPGANCGHCFLQTQIR